MTNLTCHLLHDPLLVVVAQTPRELVIVHRWPILLYAPPAGDLLWLHQFKFHSSSRPHDAPSADIGLIQQCHEKLPQLQGAASLVNGQGGGNVDSV